MSDLFEKRSWRWERCSPAALGLPQHAPVGQVSSKSMSGVKYVVSALPCAEGMLEGADVVLSICMPLVQCSGK